MEVSDKAETVDKAIGVLAMTVDRESAFQVRTGAKGIVDQTINRMQDIGTNATDNGYRTNVNRGSPPERQNWAVG